MQTRERAHCARSVFPFIKKKKKKLYISWSISWYMYSSSNSTHPHHVNRVVELVHVAHVHTHGHIIGGEILRICGLEYHLFHITHIM